MINGRGFVIDTSVTIKWVVEKEDSGMAELLQDTDMFAPALFRIEAANVIRNLAMREAISTNQALDLFTFLQGAPVTIIDADEALEHRALELAIELRHPVHDCVYLAVAERMDRTLVTADRRFLNALASTPHSSRAVDLTDIPKLLSS